MKRSADLLFTREGQTLRVVLHGEIDHHNAISMREKIDDLLYAWCPKVLILDMSVVNLMDSSGLGFIMGRLNVIRKFDGKVVLLNPCPSVMKICRLAGLERIVEIKEEEIKA